MKKTIYHGDNYNTNSLDPKLMNNGNNQEGIGIYFSNKKTTAESYGSSIVSLVIDTKNFLPSRDYIGDHINKNILYKFFKACFKVDEEFWYLMTDYGIEVSEHSEIEDYHFYYLYDLMKDEQIRNFQITIADKIGVENFIKIWQDIIKVQGTYERETDDEIWYAVLYTDKKLVKENNIKELTPDQEAKAVLKDWEKSVFSKSDLSKSKFISKAISNYEELPEGKNIMKDKIKILKEVMIGRVILEPGDKIRLIKDNSDITIGPTHKAGQSSLTVEEVNAGAEFSNTLKIDKADATKIAKNYGSKWNKADGVWTMDNSGKHVMTYVPNKGQLFSDFSTPEIEKMIKENRVQEMISVRVTLEDGDTFITGINGTIQTARQYYVGNYFNFGVEGDRMVKAIKVELI